MPIAAKINSQRRSASPFARIKFVGAISRRQSKLARKAAAKPIAPSAPASDCAAVGSSESCRSSSPAGAAKATNPDRAAGNTLTDSPLMRAAQPGT